MKIKYFPDTDTLLVTFNDRPVVETRDLNDNVLIDLGDDGLVVAMTVEHAKEQTDVREFAVELAAVG